MKLNKKAFTLIELIIVLAIMSILTTGIIVGIRSITSANVTDAAKRINSAMSKLRLENMTKTPKSYLYLYNIGGVLYMNVSEQSGVTVGNGGIDATFGIRLANNVNLSHISFTGIREDIGEGEKIEISFSRSSGAFLSDYESLILTGNGSGKTSTIRCIKETGKHFVE